MRAAKVWPVVLDRIFKRNEMTVSSQCIYRKTTGIKQQHQEIYCMHLVQAMLNGLLIQVSSLSKTEKKA